MERGRPRFGSCRSVLCMTIAAEVFFLLSYLNNCGALFDASVEPKCRFRLQYVDSQPIPAQTAGSCKKRTQAGSLQAMDWLPLSP